MVSPILYEVQFHNLSMCREAIPLAGRFRPREVLPEGTGIAQVIYLQFLIVSV